MPSRPHYTVPARAAHWLMAALMLAAFPLGVYMHDLPLSPLKLQLISYHKWLGVAVLLLILPRLVVRLAHTPPAPLPAPTWQQKTARATHLLLYALMIAVPVTGWLMSSAKGFPVVFLGVLPLPDLVGKNKELGDLFTAAHEVLNYTLLALVGQHNAAALKHHINDRHRTLTRKHPEHERVR